MANYKNITCFNKGGNVKSCTKPIKKYKLYFDLESDNTNKVRNFSKFIKDYLIKNRYCEVSSTFKPMCSSIRVLDCKLFCKIDSDEMISYGETLIKDKMAIEYKILITKDIYSTQRLFFNHMHLDLNNIAFFKKEEYLVKDFKCKEYTKDSLIYSFI